MLHPDTELVKVSDAIGYGVVATKPLPRGTITWALDPLDQVLDPGRVEALGERYMPIMEKYTYVDGAGRRILCWDFARFMNHSCAPVSLSPGLPFELAVRDIGVGEEITSDYGALNLERPFRCQCGSAECRGLVRPEDFEQWSAHWDARIRAAFARIRDVPQPLAAWIDDHAALDRCVADPASIPSILLHRWQPAAVALPKLAGGAR